MALIFNYKRVFSPRILKLTLFGFLAVFFVYLGLAGYLQYSSKVGAIFSFPWKNYGLLVLGLVALAWFLRGLRWHYYLRYLGFREVPFWKSLQIFFASFTFTITPAKAGELAKAALLKIDFDVPLSKTTSILIVERLMDLVAVLFLAIGSLFLSSRAFWPFLICCFLVIAVLLAIFFGRFFQPFLKKHSKTRFLKWLLEKISEILKASHFLITPRTLPLSLVLSFVAWSIEAMAFFLVLNGLKIPVGFFSAIFIYGLATLAGAISMLPGGIGGTEGTMLGMLVFQGIKATTALPAIFIIRLCTLWFVPIVASFFMIFLLKKMQNKGSIKKTYDFRK